MEWKDGQMINKLGKCLPKQSVFQLEEGLLSLPPHKRLSFDSFSSLNICFGASGMWLAETEFDSNVKSHADYKKEAFRCMNQLRMYYCK